MKSASVRLLASAGVIALIAAGCGTSANGDGDSSSGNEANALAEEMRSWDACEVADNLQPIWDYMQIEAVQGSDAFNSAAWGTGMDGEALACNGLITVSSWTRLDGTNRVNDGELWLSIIPWENEAQAEESYEERTGEDIERLFHQNSSLEEIAQSDLGSEWDEGVLLVLKDESRHLLNTVARDGQWMIQLKLSYNDDSGKKYFYQNEDLMDGQTLEDFAYPFGDEELQQWLANEYIPSLHQLITDRIGEE